LEGLESPKWCCSLTSSVPFTTSNSSVHVFHDLDKFGDCANDCAWFLIRLWGLLTFGCDGWDFELHWAKSNIKLGFNSPSKCLQFVFSFRFGFPTMSLVSLFLLPSQPRSHILHWFFWRVSLNLKKFSGCHFNLFLKKMNSHFGLF
jgi:hypothetical protein